MAVIRPNTLPFDSSGFRLNPARVLLAVLALLVAIGAFSSFYQVPASSVAIVQRFGKYLTTTEPGLHFKLPFGLDQVSFVEVRRQLKLEFGYGTRGASNDFQYNQDTGDMELEKNMVTGDLNAAVVEWVVQFHISDARMYVFNFLEPQATLRDISESVMREVVGDRSIDEVLTVGRQEMEVKALEKLQSIASTLNPPTPYTTEINLAASAWVGLIPSARPMNCGWWILRRVRSAIRNISNSIPRAWCRHW